MEKKIVFGIFIVFSLVSCSRENVGLESDLSNSVAYKISELPQLPDFAKPIRESGEIREFSLIKKDGTKLNFDLKSAEQTLFGKKRTLTGTVEANEKYENAIMIIGDNGFELYFKDNGEELVLKGKKDLDVGVEELDLNFDKAEKKEFLVAANKLGHNGEVLLKNYLNQQSTSKKDDSHFEVITEKYDNYRLINETATLRRKELVEGRIAGGCLSIVPPVASPQLFNSSKPTGILNKDSRKTYNIEVAYMEKDFPYMFHYVKLVYSLMQVGRKLGLKKEEYCQVPNFNFYKPEDTPAAKAEYLASFARVSDADKQLKHLVSYNIKHPNKLGFKVVRCAFFTGHKWSNSNLGLAYVGTYGNSYSGKGFSSLIISDLANNAFAHECGHNLGADHVNDVNDVMYRYNALDGSGKYEHLDKGNLSAIKDCIQNRW
ncbi:zinc-dependent metalloprotease family protein [Flavobacterium sp. UGB4466]|uniref:zinc-dependent metalloprotease family protein n=1 Tax=Flavobacterium sp. UGB4466 TaxID=2730889 RepID=UPI00192BC6FE|nr:zinc-dependent metalloprotease family protein [Flavobacterium sp. UGB4466]